MKKTKQKKQTKQKKPQQICLNKLCEPKKKGSLSLPNMKYFCVVFEMSKLTEHWNRADADLDWVLMEWELTFPFKLREAPAQTITMSKISLITLFQGIRKMVWVEVHKICQISQYTQKYAPIWQNPKFKIGRQSIYWAQWVKKGIKIIDNLFENGNFLSYNRLQKRIH